VIFTHFYVKSNLLKLLDIYQRLVSEAVATPEAPEWAPFGEYAWAPHREGVPAEPDNALEKIIFKQLSDHFGDYHNRRNGLPQMTSNFLLTLVETGWYKKVLHPPPHKTLYRGLFFKTSKELAKFLGITETEVKEEKCKVFVPPKVFKNKNGWSTSWSYKKNVTRDFSESGKKGWAITLIADVKDNPNRFLAGPGGLYDVRGISEFHLEKETVGLEPINVRRVEWKEINKLKKY